jgi:branched-chain amino acid transport system substrate-binding protein/urea transport system substrate-binding protein
MRVVQAMKARVGAVLPLSGPLARIGEQARMGLDLAATEINAAGGILGTPIEVGYRDSQTDPATAESQARALIEQQVLAIVGPVSSAARDAMAATMAQNKTPLLYATDYEGGHDARYLFFFNTVPSQSALPLLRYMHGRLGTTYALLGADYVWPRATFAVARAEIEALGGRVTSEQFVPLAAGQNYGAVIERVAASGAEILLLALDDPAFVSQAEQARLLRRLTIGFLADPAPCVAALRPGEGEGMYACVPFVASDSSSGVRTFVDRVCRLRGGDAPVSAYVMTHYNALMALKAGLERSGEIGREAAVEGMTGLTFQTPTGRSWITSDHHTALNMYIARTGRGSVHVVEALGAIEASSKRRENR